MKTLDEVITELEDEGLFPDALHYLKAYRENQRTYEENSRKAEEARDRYLEAVRNCELAENKYRRFEDELNGIRREHIKQMKNDPLTWDELKQMDMQPVWYESLYWGVKTWAMVLVQKEGIYIDWYHRCQDGQIIKGNRCEIYKDQQGERWQAYRKERE